MDGQRYKSGNYRVSLVIPAYNEEAGIAQAVAEADEALARLAGEYEILVVDDGSTDDTAAVVESLLPDYPHLRLLRHDGNQGYGRALRTGFGAARFDRIAFTDADCQFHLDDLGRLLPLTAERAIAVGERIDRQDPWLRRLLSRGYNVLARKLLGTRVHDCDCALKVFRRDALERILPETNGFFVNTEMLARARQLGLRVDETGVRHRPRLRGTSKVSLFDVPRTLASLLPFWWSKVLFAGEPAGASRSSSQGEANGRWQWQAAALLLLAAALLFLGQLGAPLQEPDEARYAEVPRQMLAQGRWVVPVLHGEPYLDKPPLLYWSVMASYQVFGVHEESGRFVSGLAAFLTIVLTWLWGRWALGPTGGLIAGAVLCLAARFLYLARMLTPDGLLTLWVTGSLAAGHVALASGRLRWGWWLVSAACCGLGLLTKGPVAFVLTAVPMLAFQLLDPRTARPSLRAWTVFLALSLGVAAPWFVAVQLMQPEFAAYFFWKHHVVRFVAPFDHAKPFWFHLPGLLLGLLPWTLLLPGMVRWLGQKRAAVVRTRPAALGFFLLTSVWGIVFFSLAGSKRAVYILPVLPPLALAIGCYLEALRTTCPTADVLAAATATWRTLPLRRLARRATLTALLLGAGCVVVATVSGLLALDTGFFLTVGVLGLAACLWHAGAIRTGVSWGTCAATLFVLLLTAVHFLLPPYARRFSIRGSLRPHIAACADPAVPVVCYPRRWDSVGFYLRRDDVQVCTPEDAPRLHALLHARPQTLLVIRTGDALTEFVERLPATLEFVPQGRQTAVTVGQVRPRLLWAGSGAHGDARSSSR